MEGSDRRTPRYGGSVQQLHLVGFTTDHKGLILGTRRGTDEGSYVVALDRAFVDQVEQLLRLQAGESAGDSGSGASANGSALLLRRPKTESKLTPRQVQTLLRSGRTVNEIAEEAGMSEEWVGRFAAPVLAEQARVIERATGLAYIRPKIGPSTQALGESVIWNLAERGIILSGEAIEDAWTSFQQPDGGWVVRVAYLAERRRQHADWTIDMGKGVLKAVNRLANELGFVEAGRRRPAALPPPAPVSASAQRAASAPPRPTTPPPPVARPSGRLSLLGTGLGLPKVAPTERAPRVADRPSSSPSGSAPSGSAPASAKDSGAADRPAPRDRVRERPEGDFSSPDIRPRPLRPLRAGGSSALRVSRPPATATSPATDAPGPDAPGPDAPGHEAPKGAAAPAAPPGPRRERPLRAPSRVKRDELAEPPVLPPTRRPVVGPAAGPLPFGGRVPLDPAFPPSGANRFGPAHGSSERKTSTAERFGIGYPGRPGGRPPEPEPEPVPNNHAAPAGESRAAPRRPLRARALIDDEHLDDDDPLFVHPDDDRRAARRSTDPITAPVPAVDILSDEDVDAMSSFDADLRPSSDQVLIRAGQARAVADPRDPTAKPRVPPEERQGRLARRKARRRDDGSS